MIHFACSVPLRFYYLSTINCALILSHRRVLLWFLLRSERMLAQVFSRVVSMFVVSGGVKNHVFRTVRL